MLTIPVTIKSLYCFFQVSGEGNATSGLWPQDLIGFCLKFIKYPGLLIYKNVVKTGHYTLVYMILLSENSTVF